MSRQDRWSWFTAQNSQRRSKRQGRLKSASRAFGRGFGLGRQLHVEPLEDRRMLAVITVDSLADNAFPDDAVTLREAITAANTDTSVDGSVAGSGADTIKFDAALSGQTITLGGSELEITEALTVDARALAVGVTIDADELSRIFNITATAGDFTLAGLTITGGKTTGDNASGETTFNGGAVRSLTSGSLTIDQSTVSDSSTTGNAYGGGIFSAGNFVLTNSTVSGNSTTSLFGFGGGIFSFGTTSISSSTISGNSTTGIAGFGGGLFSYGAALITHSTISGNSASGSSALGGGLGVGNTSSLPTLTILNSIVSGNTAGDGNPDLYFSNGTPTLEYSLIGDTTDSGITGATGTGNVLNQDPLLGPLAENGGPTQTHALLAGSPAIDTGDPSILFDANEFDQRGSRTPAFVRVFDGDASAGARIDMGAFEAQTFDLVVDTLLDESDGDFSTGDLSLREAVELTNANPGADTITFDATVFATPQTIALALGEIEITNSLTIDATLANKVTIDAQQNSRLINFTALTGDLALNGLTLQNGRTTDNGSAGVGGGILFQSDGTLSLTGSTLSGNSTTGFSAYGGGIFAFVGDMILTNSTLSDNSTTGQLSRGGGIATTSGDVTLTNSTLSGNSTLEDDAPGGGIRTYSGTVTLNNSTLSGNSTAGIGSDGGGIFTYSGDVTLANSTLVGNNVGNYIGISAADGGGIFVSGLDALVTISHSIVAGNEVLDGINSPADFFFNNVVLLDVDFSLIGSNANTTLVEAQTPDAAGNLIGGGIGSTIDPLLGLLADRGGTTQTHALLAGSPAIDAGDPLIVAPPANDQRGAPFLRQIGTIDIGAFEVQVIPSPLLVVDTLIDENDGDYTVGDLSLREAISLANTIGSINSITFDAALSGGTINLSQSLGELAIIQHVTIDASSLDTGITIDAGDGTDNLFGTGDGIRVFNIIPQDDFQGTDSVHLIGLTLTGGDVADSGGAILIDGVELHIFSSTISGNSAGDEGGGIYSSSSDTRVTSSTLTGNSAGTNGGGIHFDFGTLGITSSTISGNSADNSGGGIYSSSASIVSSTITNNHADADNNGSGTGGGVNIVGSLVLFHALVAENELENGTLDDISAAVLLSSSFNLIGVDTGLTGISDGIAGNQIGTSGAPLDPLLGALADNGGPTQTHALLAGSPAIDAGDPVIVFDANEFDQRGAPFVRVANGGVNGVRIDIGAYESIALIVDTLVDENDGDYSSGDLSLREATVLANMVPGAETITFAAALDGGTITLGGTDLEITESLTIDATALAQSVMIDANSASRIFNITATTGDFTLAGLTITGGRTLTDLTEGQGGAVRSLTSGSLTINQSTVSGSSTAGYLAYGGGISSSGPVILTNSTVSGNSTTGNYTLGLGPSGGGIHSSGYVSLTNSTVSGNSTTSRYALGGGIHSSGYVTLTNSTVSGNSTTGFFADGGGIFSFGDVTLTSSTVTDNHANNSNATGGGIRNGNDTIVITNSILAGNTTGGSRPDINPGTGTFAANFSLLGTAVTPDPGGSGNLFNDTPLLGPLADNGGPTETHALLAGSLAIDAGDPAIAAPPAFDQRGVGFPRLNGTIDIGAFEVQPEPLVVDTLVDEDDGNHSAGDLSLREAIALANAGEGTGTITFAAALDGGTIDLLQALGELTITEEVSIDASSLASGLTLDAGDGTDDVFNTKDGFRIFNINDGTSTRIPVQLIGLTLTGGDVPGTNATGGGAIDTQENLTLTSVMIVGNSGFAGGGIRSRFGDTLTLISSTISGNAANRGGGIYSAGSATTIDDSTISDNSTSGSSSPGGGGIRSNSGSLTITSSTISGNMAMGTGGNGGGISLFSSPLILTTSTVSSNSAGRDGGGIVASNSDVTITTSTISGNTANIDGGGIVVPKLLTITSSTITGNRADNDNSGSGVGGGIVNKSTLDSLLLSHTLIAGNDLGNGSQDDISSSIPIDATSDFNLIGVDTGFTGISDGVAGNLIGTSGAPIDPLLGPLADNGGLTETHALLTGSPAIDLGDPSIVFNPAEFDQRGASFVRVVAGRIDIGAVEVQPVVASADFDTDGDVDGADFLAWQRGFGRLAPNASPSDGDANGDQAVDAADLVAWQDQYGQSAPLAAAATAPLAAEPLATANLIDAVMALANDSQAREAPALDEVPAYDEVYADRIFAVDTIAPTDVFTDDNERPDTNLSKVDKAETPWLADELLERVFG